jgi:hypothetical protein
MQFAKFKTLQAALSFVARRDRKDGRTVELRLAKLVVAPGIFDKFLP